MRERNGTAGTEYLSGMSGRKEVYPCICPNYTCVPYPQQVSFPLCSVQIDLMLCQRLGYPSGDFGEGKKILGTIGHNIWQKA